MVWMVTRRTRRWTAETTTTTADDRMVKPANQQRMLGQRFQIPTHHLSQQRQLAAIQWRQHTHALRIIKYTISGAGDGLFVRRRIPTGTKLYYFGRFYTNQDDWDRRREHDAAWRGERRTRANANNDNDDGYIIVNSNGGAHVDGAATPLLLIKHANNAMRCRKARAGRRPAF